MHRASGRSHDLENAECSSVLAAVERRDTCGAQAAVEEPGAQGPWTSVQSSCDLRPEVEDAKRAVQQFPSSDHGRDESDTATKGREASGDDAWDPMCRSPTAQEPPDPVDRDGAITDAAPVGLQRAEGLEEDRPEHRTADRSAPDVDG